MDWNSRPGQNGQQPSHTAAQGTAAVPVKKSKRGLANFRGLRVAQVGLLFSVAVLVIAVAGFIAVGGGTKAESSFVDEKKLQAVFLNGGQVYFGDITELNGKYLSMSNIYYLRVNQQVQPNQTGSNASNDISLVKLGCELHGPQDSMVINREQIIFWENLKDDGQVAKAVADYQKQNPDGQKCDQANAQTNTPANTNTGDGDDEEATKPANNNTTTPNSTTP